MAGRDTDTWTPASQLKRVDADVTLLLLSQTGLIYESPSDDPFFAAHQTEDERHYTTDSYVSALGCAEQIEVCNPHKKLCTPLAGVGQVNDSLSEIGLSLFQKGVARRIIAASITAAIHLDPFVRGATALRAHETVSLWSQIPLPPDQWIVEVSSWFKSGLARMQQAIVEYATGPLFTEGMLRVGETDPIRRKMCSTQKFRSTEPSTSFSVLGMFIVLAIGFIITPIGYFPDSFIGSPWGRPFKRRLFPHRRQQWILNSTLQLQRIAFERAKMGTWTGQMEPVPVTRPGELLGELDSVGCSNRLLASSSWARSTDDGEETGEARETRDVT